MPRDSYDRLICPNCVMGSVADEDTGVCSSCAQGELRRLQKAWTEQQKHTDEAKCATDSAVAETKRLEHISASILERCRALERERDEAQKRELETEAARQVQWKRAENAENMLRVCDRCHQRTSFVFCIDCSDGQPEADEP